MIAFVIYLFLQLLQLTEYALEHFWIKLYKVSAVHFTVTLPQE